MSKLYNVHIVQTRPSIRPYPTVSEIRHLYKQTQDVIVAFLHLHSVNERYENEGTVKIANKTE